MDVFVLLISKGLCANICSSVCFGRFCDVFLTCFWLFLAVFCSFFARFPSKNACFSLKIACFSSFFVRFLPFFACFLLVFRCFLMDFHRFSPDFHWIFIGNGRIFAVFWFIRHHSKCRMNLFFVRQRATVNVLVSM